MADKKPPADAKPAVDPVTKKPWEIEAKWMKQDYYSGSKYPPFSVEPLPYERQRLAGSGMTQEDRALRRQWVKDQQLSPNEPRYVKELQQRNIFRRLYMGPTDFIFSKFIPIIGKAPASMARVVIPRMFLIVLGGYWAYYQLKYHPRDWTRSGGFHVYRNKPMILCPQDQVPEKDPTDYHDLGFKCRTVLLDGITSSHD